MKWKPFFRYFLIAFVVCIVICLPVQAMISRVSNAKLFNTTSESGEEVVDLQSLMDADVLVDSSSPFFEAFRDKKRVNFLLLGVNTGLTDTIMLASFDMEAKQINLISIPRDTYYPRKGYNSDAEKKINAAYRGNVVNTANAVSDLLEGIPIHYYALVDYDGIGKIVDALGGVPVEIPFDMDYDDPKDTPPLHIHFKEGPKTLNGEEAVEFLRYRKDKKKGYGYAEGDVGRVAAQQEFMKSAFRQAMNLKNMPTLVSTVCENITSNVDPGIALKIGLQSMGMDETSITAQTLPGKPQGEAPWYWYPDEEAIDEMLTEIYSIEPSTAGAITDGKVSEETPEKKPGIWERIKSWLPF